MSSVSVERSASPADSGVVSFRPSLFVLGAMKCGTSTLHAYLADLPDVCMSDPKEPFYFEAEYDRGLDFYREKYFGHWQGEPVQGEARHRNLFLPYVPERIHRLNPAAKLVVVLRNPVERIFSHWYHKVYHDVENLKLRPALEADLERIEKGLRYETPEEEAEHVRCFQANGEAGDGPYRTYLDTGYYLEQIERYLDLFPRESLRVVLFEELIREPKRVLTELIEFLELDPAVNRFEGVKRENGSQPPQPPSWSTFIWHRLGVRNMLPRRLRDRVFEYGYEQVRRAVKPKLDRRTRQWLVAHYRDHNERLATWLGRDLSHWNQ